jgi:signal transduction histidine kinase
VAWSCVDPAIPGGRAGAGFARPRRCTRILAALAVFLATLLADVTVCSAAGSPHAVVFDRAQFLLSDAKTPPGDSAAWQPVKLPDEWRRSRPGVSGEGWYRIDIDLARVPTDAQAFEIPHLRSEWIDYYLNGTQIGRSRDLISSPGLFGALDTPTFMLLPRFLLHDGRNVLHFHMHAGAHPFNMDGLSRVTFGDARPVMAATIGRWELGFYALRAFLAMALGAGLITLFVWFARRTDRVMFWFSVACLTWAASGALWSALRWTNTPLKLPLMLYEFYGLVVPAVILSLRTVDLRWPRFEASLWIFFAAEVTYPFWVERTNNLLPLVWDLSNTFLLLVGVAIILYAAKRPLRWSIKIEVLALVLMAACMFHEGARYLGWVDLESPVLRQYHVPIMLLALGLAVFERHGDAMRKLEGVNTELKRRVEEKAREIEAFHAEREARLRQEALIRDRQRILADMHDGLGASLVGLLRYAQAGAPDAHGLELRVKEALQELRIAIDALEPAEGDLASVLGKLRYRFEPLVESAGARLSWDVDELPPVEALEPSAVFAIQRILLEAVSNAMQHAGARRIRITARARGNEAICIDVEDDGRGFDPARSYPGLGLANMRRRAEALGASLEIASKPGGTTVSLAVPRRIAQPLPTAYPEAAAALPA